MKRPLMLSIYGWTYWLPILLAGTGVVIVLIVIARASGMWPAWVAMALVAVLTLAALAFFRDPSRHIPAEPEVMVAPADGKVTEITRVEDYPPLHGPALKIGIFLSVLDVHVNRMPCAGVLVNTRYQEGLFLDARHPESGPKNQSHTLVLAERLDGPAIAVVRQVVGAIARRIIAPVRIGERFERGQRFGMIAFGSRTELIVPAEQWQAAVTVGRHVAGGRDVILQKKK